ncbi:MAG: proton-conducting transporter membrane subunit [Bacteroidales bacterium]|nr:proton-conducting transporter membrane subunit [Bacteroidales bacterium]
MPVMNEPLSILAEPSACWMLQMLIMIPLAAGLLFFLIPERFLTLKGILALLITLVTGYLAVALYSASPQMTAQGETVRQGCLTLFDFDLFQKAGEYLTFTIDGLSKLIILFISTLALLILLFSLIYNRSVRVNNYYPLFLITIGCSYGAVLSDNLILFVIFWGILGITLYKLIPGRNEKSSAAAKKTMILIGASDTIMLVGIALLWRLTDTLSISGISLETNNILTVSAFLALLVGSFTKAGAFPFHSWVPDFAENAPASSSAFLPASLDKLLGIYFLARLTGDLFVLSEGMKLVLLITGVLTIITAVMMALMQHDYKRLLGYHAVSQVGYMVLGFGIGTAVGFAAGLFHMINHAIYKSGLFLTAGAIERQTGKSDIADLGGLAKAMPVTFVAALIFAMSISGVPPFNGFASKWMIYQGIIEFGSGEGIASRMWIIWLGLAVFGSALTLASFVKFIGGIFLGRRDPAMANIKEVPIMMWVPMAILALACVIFGVFATGIIIPKLFTPVVGSFIFNGLWSSSFVSLMVLISIVLGLLIYLATGKKKFRTEENFIGGENKEKLGASFPATEFYKTFTEFKLFSRIYKKAEGKAFDIYDLSKKGVFWLSERLSNAHTGVLPGYVIWVCAGLIIMLLIMM